MSKAIKFTYFNESKVNAARDVLLDINFLVGSMICAINTLEGCADVLKRTSVKARMGYPYGVEDLHSFAGQCLGSLKPVKALNDRLLAIREYTISGRAILNNFTKLGNFLQRARSQFCFEFFLKNFSDEYVEHYCNTDYFHFNQFTILHTNIKLLIQQVSNSFEIIDDTYLVLTGLIKDFHVWELIK